MHCWVPFLAAEFPQLMVGWNETGESLSPSSLSSSIPPSPSLSSVPICFPSLPPLPSSSVPLPTFPPLSSSDVTPFPVPSLSHYAVPLPPPLLTILPLPLPSLTPSLSSLPYPPPAPLAYLHHRYFLGFTFSAKNRFWKLLIEKTEACFRCEHAPYKISLTHTNIQGTVRLLRYWKYLNIYQVRILAHLEIGIFIGYSFRILSEFNWRDSGNAWRVFEL